MRIGIVSDTHGDVKVWERLVNSIFQNVDLILHGGDVLYHGPRNPIPSGYNPSELAERINSSPVPVLIAQGNCDAQVDQLLLQIPLAFPYLFTVLKEKRLLIHHGHLLSGERLENMVNQWEIDLCISGHTHVPDFSKINNCTFFNPGSCSLPKGQGIATVGIWEDDFLRLIDINSGQALQTEAV